MSGVLPLPYAGHRWLGRAVRERKTDYFSGHRAKRGPAEYAMSDEKLVSDNTPPRLRRQLTTAMPRLRRLVQEKVRAERYAHIERVAALAGEIAVANAFTPLQRCQVATAALLHDAARDCSSHELLELAPPRLDLEREHPLALHGRAARVLAERWGVQDEVVLNAVEGHVFGVPVTDLVGMAVYVADVCEPGRHVNDELREVAKRDLHAAYRDAVRTKVAYLQRSGKAIHPDTYRTYQAIEAAESNLTARQTGLTEA